MRIENSNEIADKLMEVDPMKLRILLIDDDPVNNELSTLQLNRYDPDIEIIEKTSVNAALEYLDDENNPKPNVILLDINLPVMNGWQFLEIQEEKDSNLIVFMLSSSVHYRDRERAKQYKSVKGFLEKPMFDDTIELMMHEINMHEKS